MEPVVVVENYLVSVSVVVTGSEVSRAVTRLATVEARSDGRCTCGRRRAGQGGRTVGLGGRGHAWEKLALLCIESWRVLCRLEDMLGSEGDEGKG